MSNLKEQQKEIVYASVLTRIASTIIDIVIVIITITIIGILIPKTFFFKTIINILIVFYLSLYLIISQSLFGVSIGKHIMRIKLLKSDFNKVSFSSVLKRYSINLIIDTIYLITQIYIFTQIYENNKNLDSIYDLYFVETNKNLGTKIIGTIFILYWILKLIIIMFDKKIRSIHDIIADTIVVYDNTIK